MPLKARSHPQVLFLRRHPPWFSEARFQCCRWSSPCWLNWLARKIQASTCFCLPSTGIAIGNQTLYYWAILSVILIGKAHSYKKLCKFPCMWMIFFLIIGLMFYVWVNGSHIYLETDTLNIFSCNCGKVMCLRKQNYTYPGASTWRLVHIWYSWEWISETYGRI